VRQWVIIDFASSIIYLPAKRPDSTDT